MTDPIPARLAALKTIPLPDLKAEWRTLFGTEPPPSIAGTSKTASATNSRSSPMAA